LHGDWYFSVTHYNVVEHSEGSLARFARSPAGVQQALKKTKCRIKHFAVLLVRSPSIPISLTVMKMRKKRYAEKGMGPMTMNNPKKKDGKWNQSALG